MMTICPNCAYQLVLLDRRRKYKCALCSRLFPQKKVEAKEFFIKNKLQRELDVQNIKIEYEKEWKQLKDLRRGVERLFKGYSRISKEQAREYCKKWRSNHKVNVKTKEKDKTYSHRLKQRLAYWRTKQKELALLFLKNNKQEASSNDIFKTPFTFLLSDLLIKSKLLKEN